MRNLERPSSQRDRRENRERRTPRGQSEGNASQENIRNWLKQVRFRRRVAGGVRESDVWKKISELNTMYEAALSAERIRYDTLLKEQVPILAQQMAWQMYQRQRAAEWENKGNGQTDRT